MKSLSRVLATFFGLGLVPLAPGTVASAAAAIGYLLGLQLPLF